VSHRRVPVTFKVTQPHTPGQDYHHWWFPNGWRGTPTTEERDRAGRLAGKRDAHFPEWLVLECNNTKCAGRAVVPVAFVLDHADSQDPEATP
jgi:hypothetical protein